MKKLVWFKEGDPIPDKAVFIKSERRVIHEEEDEVSWALGTVKTYGEFYLYEVPVEGTMAG